MTLATALMLTLATSPGSGITQPGDRTVMLATALATGHAAAGRKDVRRLRRALAEVEMIGGRAEDTDVTIAWRAILGGKAPPPQRGRGLGPAYRMGTLAKGTSVLIEQVFLAGQDARIAVQALERGTLQLEVIDPDRRAPCAPPAGFQAHCQWIPLYTQRVSIRLTNAANAPTSYYLVVN